jgi:transposase
MHHTPDERIAIGEQIYKHELSKKEAMEKYGIGKSTVDNYVRIYKERNGIPISRVVKPALPSEMQTVPQKPSNNPEINEYMAMSKEELIRELVMSKANELRAKKGYEVKGAGANKEYVSLNNKNSK